MNTNLPQLLSAVRLCSPCRALDQPVWIPICKFDCCFHQQFHLITSLAPNKEPREVNFCIILLSVVPLVQAFTIFSVRLTVSEAVKASEGALELFPPLVVVVTSFGASVMPSCVTHLSNCLHSICSHL